MVGLAFVYCLARRRPEEIVLLPSLSPSYFRDAGRLNDAIFRSDRTSADACQTKGEHGFPFGVFASPTSSRSQAAIVVTLANVESAELRAPFPQLDDFAIPPVFFHVIVADVAV